jgi:holin-like protein
MANAGARSAVIGRISRASGINLLLLCRERETDVGAVRARLRGSMLAAKTLVTIGGQVGLLWAIFGVSNVVVTRLHLRVPGNIVGMLLLLALLSIGVVQERWVAAAAGVLTKHLAFFFIPIAVGLMDCGGLLWPVGHRLLLAIVVSSVAGMVVSGGLIQLFGPRGRWEMR